MSLTKMIEVDKAYANPSSLPYLQARLDIEPGSFLPETKPNFSPAELRSTQDHNFAQHAVAKGIQYAKSGDYDSAFRYYGKALDVEPRNRDAHVAKGAA